VRFAVLQLTEGLFRFKPVPAGLEVENIRVVGR
jgi:hypothetical protein